MNKRKIDNKLLSQWLKVNSKEKETKANKCIEPERRNSLVRVEKPVRAGKSNMCAAEEVRKKPGTG